MLLGHVEYNLKKKRKKKSVTLHEFWHYNQQNKYHHFSALALVDKK